MQNDQTVQLIRERNENGMQSLLKHYGPLIRYVAEPILENASDCEELLQDVALRVWERIDRYDEAKARFSTWVTTITRNAALDKLKRRCETESYEELSDQMNGNAPLNIRLAEGSGEDAVEKAVACLKEIPSVKEILQEESCLLRIRTEGGEQENTRILRELMNREIPVCDFHRASMNLEKVFMEVTGDA